jgi:hypothetical protein
MGFVITIIYQLRRKRSKAHFQNSTARTVRRARHDDDETVFDIHWCFHGFSHELRAKILETSTANALIPPSGVSGRRPGSGSHPWLPYRPASSRVV